MKKEGFTISTKHASKFQVMIYSAFRPCIFDFKKTINILEYFFNCFIIPLYYNEHGKSIFILIIR